MGWTAIFSIIDKVLPSREERIRNKINELEIQKQELLDKTPTARNVDRVMRITDELSSLKKKLENR